MTVASLQLIVFPHDDTRFERLARRLADGPGEPGQLTPGRLEQALRATYEHATVHVRERLGGLEPGTISVWYVYRDGTAYGDWDGVEASGNRP